MGTSRSRPAPAPQAGQDEHPGELDIDEHLAELRGGRGGGPPSRPDLLSDRPPAGSALALVFVVGRAGHLPRAPEGRRLRRRARAASRDANVVLGRGRGGLRRRSRSPPTWRCSGACSAARGDSARFAGGWTPSASYQITMAGLAATRIFSAAGAGGIVLTYWALRKAGMPRRRSACRMVAFLALTYSVYLFALIVFGVLLRTGVLPGDNPVGGTIVPAGDRRRGDPAAGPDRAHPGRLRAAALATSRGDTRTASARREAGHAARPRWPPGVRTAIDYIAPSQPGGAGGGGRDRLLGGQHRDPVGELRGVRRRRAVRRARPGLLRRHGGQPDPVARRRRRLGRRGHDRRVRAVRRAQRRSCSRRC